LESAIFIKSSGAVIGYKFLLNQSIFIDLKIFLTNKYAAKYPTDPVSKEKSADDKNDHPKKRTADDVFTKSMR
jgi:hypothetical protein